MRKLFSILAALLALTVLPCAALAQENDRTLIPLKDSDVVIEGTTFPYTGAPIEPAVTVTVEDKVLEADTDYMVEYANNLIPGTGTVIVRGIVTASETLGYTGEVKMEFTITEASETPETSEPAETPETSAPTEAPGTSAPTEAPETEPAKPEYKLTKGDGATWYQGSSAALSFTANGPFDGFTGVSVDGKKLDAEDYQAKSGTVVLLNNAFLKALSAGEHTITIHFAEDDAQGTFTIAAADENPKTGDTVYLWIGVLLISLTAAAVVGKKHFTV